MRQTKYFFIIITLLFSYGFAQSSTESVKIKIIADKAYVYLEPNENSVVMDTVVKGEVLDISGTGETTGKWHNVFYDSKRRGTRISGFVKSSMAAIVIDDEENRDLENSDVVVIKEGVVLRLEPNENSLAIKNIPPGAKLHTEGSIGKWLKINLPPDNDGIVITGYIHNSFIKFEKSIPVKSEKKMEENIGGNIESIMEKENYYKWERELARAKNKKNSGMPLLLIGTAIVSPSLYFAIRGPEEGRYYYTWGKILIGAGILSGTICMVWGVTNMSRGQVLLKQLKEEGRSRGYIVAGLLPEYRAIGLQIKISF